MDIIIKNKQFGECPKGTNPVDFVCLYDRIDILKVLSLKPTYLELDGFYLSGSEYDKIKEYFGNKEYKIMYCHINGADYSFFKEEEKKEKIEYTKINRFKLMEI